jgi:hypothetical protein
LPVVPNLQHCAPRTVRRPGEGQPITTTARGYGLIEPQLVSTIDIGGWVPGLRRDDISFAEARAFPRIDLHQKAGNKINWASMRICRGCSSAALMLG